MSDWYYLVDGKVEGPANTNTIKELIKNNDLLPESLVWTKSMKRWSPIESIEIFNKPVGDTPPNISVNECPENDGVGIPEDSEEKSTELPLGYLDTPRPWARLGARIFDYQVFGVLVVHPFGFIYDLLIYPTVPPDEWLLNTFIFIALVSLWVFIEAFLLSTWGTTPGKWLLGTSVRNASGSKLSYGEALSRSLQVWAKGLWLGVPFFYLFGLLSSYNQLEGEMKKTSWDSHGGYVVRHKKLNFMGVILVVIVLLGLFYLKYSKELFGW